MLNKCVWQKHFDIFLNCASLENEKKLMVGEGKLAVLYVGDEKDSALLAKTHLKTSTDLIH